MKKFTENFKISRKISQKFEVSRQILDKIGVQLCGNLYCLKDVLIGFHMLFISLKNIIWFLKLRYLF